MKRHSKKEYIEILSDFGFNIFSDVTYTSRIISQEVKKGLAGNTYELPPVYFITILDFRLDDEVNLDKYYYSGKIIDEFDVEVLYDKLCYKMLVLSNFNKEFNSVI